MACSTPTSSRRSRPRRRESSNELAEVERQARALLPEADRVAQAEAALVEERAAFSGDDCEPEIGAATPSRAGEVRGELAARRATIERAVGELARVEARLAAIEARTAQLAADSDLHRRSCEQAEEAERPARGAGAARRSGAAGRRGGSRRRAGRAPGRRLRSSRVVGAGRRPRAGPRRPEQRRSVAGGRRGRGSPHRPGRRRRRMARRVRGCGRRRAERGDRRRHRVGATRARRHQQWWRHRRGARTPWRPGRRDRRVGASVARSRERSPSSTSCWTHCSAG